jgi:hypothetical protein
VDTNTAAAAGNKQYLLSYLLTGCCNVVHGSKTNKKMVSFDINQNNNNDESKEEIMYEK